MSDFNYIEYLKNNPLLKETQTKSSKLITEAQEDTIDSLQKAADDTSKMPADRDEARNKMYAMKKAKMKVSELKAKIREEILSTLNEEEDYEKMGREVEYGIFPGIDADELSPEDISAMLDKERFKPMKFDDPELDQEYQEYLATNDYDGPLEERKDEEEAPAEEEEMDAEVDVDVEAAPAQGLSAEEQEIQNSLKIAYDSASSIGDQKLADQIGNSITFFTRTHVVER
jgi:flagellar hook-basal body complex protein FliE